VDLAVFTFLFEGEKVEVRLLVTKFLGDIGKFKVYKGLIFSCFFDELALLFCFY